jgi:iron complex transport system ATP-binding protein
MAKPPSLHLRTLTLAGRTVLRDVTFAPDMGALTVLCGPNGAGKTTLLRALAGLLPGHGTPDPCRVAYVPQGARAAWGLTVRQVVALGRIPHRDAAPAPVERAMVTCGIDALRDARIDRISGGQARRAMLARAFATEPEVLLLDEPTADLDPAAAHDILRLLRRSAEEGRAVVAVLHAIDLAIAYAHRIVVLGNGRILADLPPGEALPFIADAFGMRVGIDPEPRLLPP